LHTAMIAVVGGLASAYGDRATWGA
jgi:hypothetical protein